MALFTASACSALATGRSCFVCFVFVFCVFLPSSALRSFFALRTLETL